MESMTLESSTTTPTTPSGCQPFSDRGRGSGSSPEDEGGRSRGQEHLSIPLPPLPPPPASTQASSSVASSGGEGEQKRPVLHSSSSSSTSSTSSSSSTPSSSKHRDRKHDRKHEKAIKEKEKAKIEKYDQKVKSKDKLKSDKFQDLDIFSSSKTKTPVTPYQPHRLPGQSLGKNGTPVKEGERKLETKEKQNFKTPGKVEERRRSSSNSEKKEKERRHSSSSSNSHSQSSKDRHRHESKERRNSKDEERRHSRDEKRSSSEKEERKSTEEIKRAGDKERERLLRLYSSEGGTDEGDHKKEKKYEKEREQQALESKKRLQESRERKEKEERAEKERKRLKEKERREKERRLEKEREAKEERARKERLEENKNAVKEKIQTLQPEELKMVLLESIVAKEGGNLDETQRKDVLRTLESAIVGKVVEKKKSPGKNGRRSRVSRGGDSSDDDFTPTKAKRLTTSRRKVDSESDSCSDDSNSDSGIKALKSRIADRRKSTEEMVMHQSRKSPDASTTSSRKSSEDCTPSSSKISEEKPSRKSKLDQVKTVTPKESVEPPKSKSSPIKPQQSPVKSQKSPGTQLPSSPSKLTPKQKQVAAKKQDVSSGSKSKQGQRSKAKVLAVDLPDDDPTVEPLEAFKQSDIEFLLHMKDLYGKEVEKGIDALSISSVTSSELNLAIPASRTVTIDVEGEEADVLVHTLAGYGGNPRLFTAVPSWLAPHLEASRVKEEVEMPSKQEIADHLVKKNKASKRKAGWDIVVEVVPTGPQPKKSKLEIQLGYDSAFADSLTLSGGRRSRRPNKRYSDGADDSTTPESKSILEVAPAKAINESIKTDAEVVDKNTEEEAADGSESKMEVDQFDEVSDKLNSSQTISSVETAEELVKEEEIDKSLESTRSSSVESLKLVLEDTSVDTETQVDTSEDIEMEVDASKGTQMKDDVENVIHKEEKVYDVSSAATELSSQDSKNETSAKSNISAQKSATKAKEAPKSKELASLKSNLVVKESPNGQVRELRKRKADSSASNGKAVEEDFHGWAAPPPAPMTGWKLLGAEEEEDCTLEEVGATFGFIKEDLLLLVQDQNQSQMMEVVMSPPMIQDTKRVEREDSTGNAKIVAFPESDLEERGSQSPSSFGSSKENVPEICNNNASLQKGCPNISKRRRSTKNPVLKTNTVV